jgi:hypothetical protein
MKAYDRALTKLNGNRLTAEQLVELPMIDPPCKCSGECQRSPVTAVEELLLMHPTPWQALFPANGNPAAATMQDALGYEIYLPGWGPAIAELVNASAVPAEPAADRLSWERE